MTYVNEKFTTPLRQKRKILLPRSLENDQQQFITSFFFDVVDNDEYDYIIMTFLMKNAFKIYLNVWREQHKFILYLKKFKDEFKDAYDYYQRLLITTKQRIYDTTHAIACFFTFDNDVKEILTIYVNEIFYNYINDASR